MTKLKKKSSKNRQFLRGGAVVCACAALLGAMALLLPDQAPSRPVEPSSVAQITEEPTSPIPSNPYGPEDFSYEGAYLACTAGPALPGIDVSSYQGQIDWQAVADSGIRFAMIRLGYRGTTSGGLYPDERALENLTGAAEAGLQVGAYFFSQATSVREAALEAAYCIGVLEGRQLELPVVFDWEFTGSDTRTAQMEPQVLMDCIRIFCDSMEDAGYASMVYFNSHLEQTMLELEELLDYPFWLAMYSDEMTYPHAVQMWQYSANGNVPGISGDTDLNLLFTDSTP